MVFTYMYFFFFNCMHVLTHVRVTFEVSDLSNRVSEHTITGLNIFKPKKKINLKHNILYKGLVLKNAYLCCSLK